MDPEKSLMDNLKGTSVLEFPTIVVVDEIPSDWTIETSS